jgi:hypothetical protein
MSADAKKPVKPDTKGSIDAFKIQPQSFGRLTVVATTLATGGLPQEAFKPAGERKSATTPPPARQSRD